MDDLTTALMRGELIPRFVAGILPVPSHEREIVKRMDGFRTVRELSTSEMDVAGVCHLVLELVWFRAVILEEVIVGPESEAQLARTPRQHEPHESPIVQAVLAHCASA